MTFNRVIKIGERKVGQDQPVFIIAEIGPNHNGDIQNAFKLIEQANNVGADAVKFQSFLSDHLLTHNDPMYKWTKSVEIPEEWYPHLIKCARDHNLVFFSTATNEITIDWLEKYGTDMYKIASAHVNYREIISYAAKKGKPIILSSGFSTFGELEEAVETIAATGNQSLAILHCISDYPTSPEDVNLNFIKTLNSYFDLPIGFSDHTEGVDIASSAVAVGARIVEKHITFDKNADGPDHFYALLPEEFRQMVGNIRRVEKALGKERKILTGQEIKRRKVGRRSFHALGRIKKGEVFSEKNTRLLRPGNGLEPKYWHVIIGRKAAKDIEDMHPITWDCI